MFFKGVKGKSPRRKRTCQRKRQSGNNEKLEKRGRLCYLFFLRSKRYTVEMRRKRRKHRRAPPLCACIVACTTCCCKETFSNVIQFTHTLLTQSLPYVYILFIELLLFPPPPPSPPKVRYFPRPLCFTPSHLQPGGADVGLDVAA